jgi:hypothetical protein
LREKAEFQSTSWYQRPGFVAGSRSYLYAVVV